LRRLSDIKKNSSFQPFKHEKIAIKYSEVQILTTLKKVGNVMASLISKRVVLVLVAVSLVISPIAVTPARAEPFTAIIVAKARALKLKSLLGLGIIAASPVLKTVVVKSALRAVAVRQAGQLAAVRTAVAVTNSAITIAPVAKAGIATTFSIKTKTILTFLAGAGITLGSGSAAADEELLAEIATAKAQGQTSYQPFVCESANGVFYPVPSSWERCPKENETLKAAEEPLDLKGLR